MGWPHFGHDGALSETLFPHAEQLINAMRNPSNLSSQGILVRTSITTVMMQVGPLLREERRGALDLVGLALLPQPQDNPLSSAVTVDETRMEGLLLWRP